RQAIELHALARDDLAAVAIPVRVEVLAHGAITGDRLDPVGLDAAGAARVKPRRLRELGGENPFRRLLREARARMQEEAQAARAVELSAHRRRGLRLDADVPEQARKQRAVNGRIT